MLGGIIKAGMETTSVSLYELLGVQPTATPAELTKAYRLMALRVHPDKNPTDLESASKNFQKLQDAYKILSDPDKRRIYDTTGETEDSEGFFEAYTYYREKYPKFTEQDIDEFAGKYKGSEEEKTDLVEFYEEMKGDVTKILEFIILSEEGDIPRYLQIYEDLISSGSLRRTKKFDRSKTRIARLADEGEELKAPEPAKKAIKAGSDMSSLIAQIHENRTRRGEFVKEMEANATKQPAKKRKKGKK